MEMEAEKIIDAIGILDEPVESDITPGPSDSIIETGSLEDDMNSEAPDDIKHGSLDNTMGGPSESDIKDGPGQDDITPLQESGIKEPIPVEEVEAEMLNKKEEAELKLDFTQPIKDIRPDKYNSKATLDPKSQATKDEYFKIYEYYVTSHSTMLQMSEKYKCTIYHVSRVIKWVALTIGPVDPDAALHTMIDNLKLRKQSIEAELKSCKEVDDKIKYFRALNSTDKLLSQVEILLGGAVSKEPAAAAPPLQFNSEFNRRTGKCTAAADEIVPPTDEDDLGIENLDREVGK